MQAYSGFGGIFVVSLKCCILQVMGKKQSIQIDESKLKENVFCDKLQIPVTEVHDINTYIRDSEGLPTKKVYYLERQQYAKLFYCDGAKDKIYKLSPAAKSLFLYVLHHLEHGKDWVIIDRKLYMQKNGISSINTVKKAISELWSVNLINPTAAYPNLVYWINPKYFFCGNRTKKYPDNLIIKG